MCHLLIIRNLVVRALNADWLTAVVYPTVYHGDDKTLLLLLLLFFAALVPLALSP